MKWDKDNSLQLTITGVKLFTIGMIAVMIFAPAIFKSISLINYLDTDLNKFIIIFYILCVPAAIALGGLYKLLNNIKEEKIFVDDNVVILRCLSWRCMLAAIICLVSALWYVPFVFVSAVTGFVGLILRVVKNVFAQAVEIKTDSDFTI